MLCCVGAAVVRWANRYNLEDCEFYGNNAGGMGGGAVYLRSEMGESGVVTLTRYGKNRIFQTQETTAIIAARKWKNKSVCRTDGNNMTQTPLAESSPLPRPTFEANSAADNGSIVSIACGDVVVESEFASQYETGEVLKCRYTSICCFQEGSFDSLLSSWY